MCTPVHVFAQFQVLDGSCNLPLAADRVLEYKVLPIDSRNTLTLLCAGIAI